MLFITPQKKKEHLTLESHATTCMSEMAIYSSTELKCL